MKRFFLKPKNLIFAFCFFAFSPLFAQNSQNFQYKTGFSEWKNKKYSAKVAYNKKIQIGDAIFFRLDITPQKNLKNQSASTGKIEFFLLDSQNVRKKLNGAKLYEVQIENRKSERTKTLFAGVPTSTFLKAGEYEIRATFSPFGLENEVISVPVEIEEKSFVEETIPLDAKNTAIKTDSSKTRATQIDTLNKILDTANYEAIYETKNFLPPTQSTRRTSFFADRRIYAYSNGKSQTGLHYGIDYGIKQGSTVTSCAKGKVVLAAWRNSTGFSVCIEHLPNLYSLYYHLSNFCVEEGQIVQKSQKIGESGSTGLATGPHLHWEIRLKTEAVNPDFFVENFSLLDFF